MICHAILVAAGVFAGAEIAPSTISIDFSKPTPISKYIYGVNFPDWKKFGIKFPVARQGGNRMSAYNWETNASNAGNDYHHQNDGYMGKSNEPGWTIRDFREATQREGAAAILTIPMAGYVSADKNEDLDVNKTPDFLNVRFLRSYASKPGGKFAYPPDTRDRAVYQDECVSWIEATKSKKTPVWYALDNEADLWSSTHVRIVPKTPTYAEFIARSIEFGSAIKKVAKNTLIFGPVSYGWQGFRRFQDATDSNDRDFLDVYMAAMRNQEKKTGKRILDVLDVHFYPEAKGAGVRVTEEKNDEPIRQARMQAPRSLWDKTYVEDSWIADSLGKKPIVLLPGLQGQIAKQYPGTRLSITEYNYGGSMDISGAIAQADVLGIYGRYNLFAACNWGMAPGQVGQIAGFKAFLDYDGSGSQFGDLGLGVRGQTPSDNSVYASLDSKDRSRMTIVAINKTGHPLPLNFDLGERVVRTVKSYVVSAANMEKPRAGNPKIVSGKVSATLAPESIETIEIRLAAPR